MIIFIPLPGLHRALSAGSSRTKTIIEMTLLVIVTSEAFWPSADRIVDRHISVCILEAFTVAMGYFMGPSRSVVLIVK